MKCKLVLRLFGFLFLPFVLCLSVSAQGTAFTYQGQLQNNGSPANGSYNLTFSLYTGSTGGTAVAGPLNSNGILVSNGLFTVTLDFGSGVWNGATNWLEIGVETNGGSAFSTLSPRQRVTPVPYAIAAAELSGGFTVQNNNTNGAPNVVGGSPVNYVFSGVVGATISGGGATNYSGSSYANAVIADFGTIGGGDGNFVSYEATVAGGGDNRADAGDSFVGGGNGNEANNEGATVAGGFDNIADGYLAIVVGGYKNHASGFGAFIGGGGFDGTFSSTNAAPGNVSVIGGGLGNTAQGNGAIVGGGEFNSANSFTATVGGGNNNSAISNYSTVSGGQYNQAISDAATVGGGWGNTSSGYGSVIAGGEDNTNSGEWATLVGGYGNGSYGQLATVAGGIENKAGGSGATISGGEQNSAANVLATVGGGQLNQANGQYSTVSGGLNNTAGGTQATVSGGNGNTAGSQATVSGGTGNTANGNLATVSGGIGNTASGIQAMVCGGANNIAAGTSSFAAGTAAQALHPGAFVWSDGSTAVAIASTNNNSVTFRAAGGFQFYTSSLGRLGAGLYVAPGGNSWINISDRNAKKDFAPVNYEDVLEKLSRVPIEQWHYKWESSGDTPNIGPMAQDFIHAFYPGRDDKGISTLQFDGVELAAIEGLNQKLDEQLKAKDAEIQELKQSVAELRAMLSQSVPASRHDLTGANSSTKERTEP